MTADVAARDVDRFTIGSVVIDADADVDLCVVTKEERGLFMLLIIGT